MCRRATATVGISLAVAAGAGEQQHAGKGGDFAELRPVHAVWLLNQNLLKGPPRWLHHFQLRDREGASFSDHLNLHTVELRRWVRPDGPDASEDSARATSAANDA